MNWSHFVKLIVGFFFFTKDNINRSRFTFVQVHVFSFLSLLLSVQRSLVDTTFLIMHVCLSETPDRY